MGPPVLHHLSMKNSAASSPSPRVRRVLRTVDELELTVTELRQLRTELAVREECSIDTTGCDSDEAAVLREVERRVNDIRAGRVQTVPMREVMRQAGENLKRFRAQKRAEKRGTRT